MNSIFHKTLIATALTAILGTTAMAADNYQETIDNYEDTIDGGTNEQVQTNQHQQNNSDRNTMPRNDKYMAAEGYGDTIDGGTNEQIQSRSNRNTMSGNDKDMAGVKNPCNNDMNLTYGSDRDDSENRNKSKHQDEVLGQQNGGDMNRATNANNPCNNDKNLTYASDKDNSENRNKSKHQDEVLGKMDRDSESDVGDADQLNIYDKDKDSRAKQDQNTHLTDADGTSSKTTGLYSMSADELVGMKVVDTNGDTIGDVTGVVLTADQEDAHAVINLGGILGMGGRDVLTSFDKLTMENENLRLHASQNQIEDMTDYGSENHVDLEGDQTISSQLRIQ